MLNQWWFNAGPPSATLAQHLINIGSTPRVCRFGVDFAVIFYILCTHAGVAFHLCEIKEKSVGVQLKQDGNCISFLVLKQWANINPFNVGTDFELVRNDRLCVRYRVCNLVIIAIRKVVPQEYGAHPIDCAMNYCVIV